MANIGSIVLPTYNTKKVTDLKRPLGIYNILMDQL